MALILYAILSFIYNNPSELCATICQIRLKYSNLRIVVLCSIF